jgi:AcrR family transcriptional regulator
MGRSGASRQLRKTDSSRDTRASLIRATIAVLREYGHAGASARTIAARAGCNQALVFYYFGSVAELLLAALDDVSSERFDRYSSVVDAAVTPEEFLEAAGVIFREDLEAGYVRVLVETVAAASSIPGFGAEVLKRIKPWEKFAQRTMARLFEGSALQPIVSSDLGGHVVAALFLGLEMLAHLDAQAGTEGGVEQFRGILPALLPLILSLSATSMREGGRAGA